MNAPQSAESDHPLTPCGMRACTGCATCVKAWANASRIDLDPWQAALVDRVFPPVETSAS